MKTIQITNEAEITAIINKCPYCMLGLTDLEGNPYVIPMNFVREGDIIYLHSGAGGSKEVMATAHPRVCITFCEGHELVYMHQQIACSYSMKSRSVVCRGTVELIDDYEEKERVLQLLMRRYTDNDCRMAPPAIRNVRVWAVKVDELSCRSFGLRPSELK